MTLHRVMTIFGTRPEAIKLAPVIKHLEADPQFEPITVVTGQHREMLHQVNEVFGVVPDHDLKIMNHGQGLSEIFSRVLLGLDPLLEKHQPDAVIIQGDTTTSTAAALAAFHQQIPVVHLEAGLRSGSLESPFPEEGNRKLTTQIASLHLAPTDWNRQNLLREGVPDEKIVVTGNTVIDALLFAAEQRTPFTDPDLRAVIASDRPIVVATVHRRENWGRAMEGIGRALATIAKAIPEVQLVVPVHKNPMVRDALLPPLKSIQNVTIVEPLGYGEFTHLLALATAVLTDSGGVQEEAPSLGKPVLVLRDTTERPEAVAAGTVKVVGTDEVRVVDEVTALFASPSRLTQMARSVNPYGDGKSAPRVLSAIHRTLQHHQAAGRK